MDGPNEHCARFDWGGETEHALKSSRILLAFITPSYLTNPRNIKEHQTFKLLGRPIVPVVFDDVRPKTETLTRLLGNYLPYSTQRSICENVDEKCLVFADDLAKGIAKVLAASEFESPPVPDELASVPRTSRTAPEVERPAKGYVFLSYAEEDSDFLEQLRSFFGDQGYAYWEFEKSDRDYQKRIDLELEGVITNAVATVSVLSESWKTSDWSVRELYFSQEIGKPVFLLKAKPFKPILAISGLPYIDFTRDSDDAFSRLAKELKRAGL